MAETKLYTIQDVMKKCQVTEQTVHHWLSSGKLESYKIGKSRRIEPADLRKFLAQHKVAARSETKEDAA